MVARNPLPCFKCGIELKPVFKGDDDQHQPWGAVMFEGPGNYGSTIHDPGPIGRAQNVLQINICDSCLIGNNGAVWHVIRRHRQPEERYSKPWQPDVVEWNDDGTETAPTDRSGTGSSD